MNYYLIRNGQANMTQRVTSMNYYLRRNGQASMTQRVTSMNLTPEGEKGGQVHMMWLRIAAASSSFKYICVCVLRAQHTWKGGRARG